MQCRNVLTRIDALRTSELEVEDQHGVEEHLSTCRSCKNSVDDLREFADVVRTLRVAEPARRCIDELCESFDEFETDGRLVRVVFTDRGLRRIDVREVSTDDFVREHEKRFGRTLRRGSLASRMRDAIARLLRGESVTPPTVDLTGLTPFEQEVLHAITHIPHGEVRSYEWVARRVGKPKATRAVGNVMARNPLPFVLPCHRVVPTSGGVGRYAFGPEMKRELLAAEGAPVEELERLAAEGVRYIGSKTTKIFCFPTCRDARRIREENRVELHDATEAHERGFRACKRCTPEVAA